MIQRKLIQVSGIVQSVGFRPFVYGLAQRHGLKGTVCNNERGVLLDLEGPPELIEQLLKDLRTESPSLARIEKIECTDQTKLLFYRDFKIIESTTDAGPKLIPVSPDVTICADCLRELFDPADRRFRYPFINCTNCGPRFTIVEDVPYDRAKTTMREFEMCADCRAEYENPLNRRFHAEPVACANCGPRVELITSGNVTVADGDDVIERTVELLSAGNIVAIKGLGGFHLACDALDNRAVSRLRRRKYREEKPFALMAASMEIVKQHCEVSESERELLLANERPIVLLTRKTDSSISREVAPRIRSFGFMLPYTPLHYLLLEKFDHPLVMTSANISDEPICYEDDDARQRLERIADYFLINNRRIHMRTDDSVARVICGVGNGPAVEAQRMILRRSRGFAPAPVKTAFKFKRQILACGAELKNTFCLARDDYAFVSHHIGDLENLETLRSFTEGIQHYKRLFYFEPEVIAYDLHPEYLSTKYALSSSDAVLKLGVQHHHAHIASCMADNGIEGDVIGVAMDGLGFGVDGCFWGGEFFVANFADAERIAHLEYVPMPGGVKAIREPWRMAAAYLEQAFGDKFLELDIPFVRELDRRKWGTMQRMTAKGINSPVTSSMGRLFDAISSLLRLRDSTNYEGQAAIELEQIAGFARDEGYEFDLAPDGRVVGARKVIRSAVEDMLGGLPVAIISAKFHLAIANLIARIVSTTREQRKLNRVVMSGGVFQNIVLLSATCERLRKLEFEVFTHERVPTNDGGISLGQAAIANAKTSQYHPR